MGDPTKKGLKELFNEEVKIADKFTEAQKEMSQNMEEQHS